MQFDVYGDDSGAIIKLDSRVKLLIFISCGFVSFGCNATLPLIIYAGFLSLLVVLCGKKWVGIFGFLLYLFIMLLRNQVLFAGIGVGIVKTIVNAIILFFVFGYPLVMSLILIIQTTKTNQLIAALEKMHLPAAAIIPVAVLFRFIPTVVDEWNGIRKAMAFRGISLEPVAIIRSPLKTVEYILVPLLFSCVSVVEEMASATLARGLDSDLKRTCYETVKMRPLDYVVIALLVAITVYAVTAGKVMTGF